MLASGGNNVPPRLRPPRGRGPRRVPRGRHRPAGPARRRRRAGYQALRDDDLVRRIDRHLGIVAGDEPIACRQDVRTVKQCPPFIDATRGD